MSEDKVCKDSEAFEPMKKKRAETVDKIEKGDLVDPEQDFDIEEEGKDADQTESPWTEETEGKIAPLSKSGSSEIDSKKDKRFSRKIEIDEKALRENAKETDTTPAGS